VVKFNIFVYVKSFRQYMTGMHYTAVIYWKKHRAVHLKIVFFHSKKFTRTCGCG
jgi:hypothetical protein